MKKKSVFGYRWKDYLSFSRREQRGILLLTLIILFECGWLFYHHYYSVPVLSEDSTNFIKKAESFFRNSKNDVSAFETEFHESSDFKKSETVRPVLNSMFDPNLLDSNGWIKVGFSPKQTSGILRYISKGGHFRKKDDLKKIYGLSFKDYERMSPWINLPDSIERQKENTTNKWISTKNEFNELNKADSLTLDKLPGIGPAFAHRIVAYRERLGGFISISQLHEIWGMNDTLFEKIVPRISLTDSIPFRKIFLNSVTEEELKRHPYVGFRAAHLIVAYRDQHGSFTDAHQLINASLISEENFRKLVPYLDIK